MPDTVNEGVDTLKETVTGLIQFNSVAHNAFDIVLRLIIIFIGTFILLKFKDPVIHLVLSRNPNTDDRKRETLEGFISGFLKFIIVFFALAQALFTLGLDKSSVVAIFGAMTVAIGLAIQDIIRDFVMGLVLVYEGEYKVDDFIEIGGVSGTVVTMGIRATTIRSIDGCIHVIPYSNISVITNFTHSYSTALVELRINYNEDVERVIAILEDEMEKAKYEIDYVMETPRVQAIFAFTESCMIIRVVCDCESGLQWDLERELRLRIKTRFDKEKIIMPYPQLIVHSENLDKAAVIEEAVKDSPDISIKDAADVSIKLDKTNVYNSKNNRY